MSGKTPAIGTLTDARHGGDEHGPQVLELRVVGGPDEGRSLLLERGTYHVGSASLCALPLTDRLVSRQHLELEVRKDGIRARDLGSKNGSYYQGARLQEVVAQAGASFLIGTTELRLVVHQGAAALDPYADGFHGIRGRSPRMRQLFELLERVARTDSTVLLEGETGTGKECCAEAIVAASPRASGPFVICDLAGVAPTLIESDLFGHRKGAFTGAHENRDGVFVRARGGTVFLDEIGELPMALQTRLLRVLDRKMVQPLGGSDYLNVDVRVIAATNRNLEEECEAGRFRQDLFHRLAVLRVPVPPLRERKEDVAELVRLFSAERAIELPAPTLALLSSYDWPGNVRELKNLVTRSLALLGEGNVLLPSLFGLGEPAAFDAPVDEGTFIETKERVIAQWEKSYLANLLASTGDNVSQAARKTGLQRPYLHRLLRKHGLRGGSDPDSTG